MLDDEGGGGATAAAEAGVVEEDADRSMEMAEDVDVMVADEEAEGGVYFGAVASDWGEAAWKDSDPGLAQSVGPLLSASWQHCQRPRSSL